MIEKDTSNTATQPVYELAKEPIFVDRTLEPQQEISWEVFGDDDQLPTSEPEELKEDQDPPEDEKRDNVEAPDSLDSEESGEEIEKKKKKNRTSEKNRISQLTRELKQAKAFTHDVLSRNQYLESKITQKEKENFESHENYLTAQKERVKKYLTDALEEGDPAKIAEANDLLGQYNAEILMVSRQKQNFQAHPPQNSYKQNAYQEPTDTDDDSYQEVGNEWIEKNTWANPKSSHFDQEMYEAADNYSIRLARKYKLEGRGEEIGTTDFFDEITDYVKNSYDIPSSQPSPKQHSRDRMQMKSDKSPHVAAVSRQGTQSASPTKAKDIVLTPEQKEAAYSMRGYVRDPKTGLKVEDNRMLEEIYKRNMMRGNG
jgi:hypothetical protein